MIKQFFKDVISNKDPSSAKRLVTLLASSFFIVAAFVILIISMYIVFNLPSGRIDPDILNLLGKVLEYSMFIILGGLGFIGVENLGQAWVERARAIANASAAASMFSPTPIQADVVENVNVDSKPKEPLNDI